jgi:hypothetical protein
MRIRVDIKITWSTVAAVVGLAVGITFAVNENLRKRTLDALSGAEDEFAEDEFAEDEFAYPAEAVAVRPTYPPGPEEPPPPG